MKVEIYFSVIVLLAVLGWRALSLLSIIFPGLKTCCRFLWNWLCYYDLNKEYSDSATHYILSHLQRRGGNAMQAREVLKDEKYCSAMSTTVRCIAVL